MDLKILEQLKDTQFPEGAKFSRLVAKTSPDSLFAGIKPTRLYSKNVSVDAINMRELQGLEVKPVEFLTIVQGDYAKRWVSSNRIPDKVTVCVGAQVRESRGEAPQRRSNSCHHLQVMCTRNFPDLGLANGSRGIITQVSRVPKELTKGSHALRSSQVDDRGVSFKKLSGHVVRINMFEV